MSESIADGEPVKLSGDFRLLNPFPQLTDEDGAYHCPSPVLNRDYDDDTDDYVIRRALCGEPLNVVWTLYCPVPDPGDLMPMEDAGKWANYGVWKLECPNGHVLMTSAETDVPDSPQPFDARQVFGPFPPTLAADRDGE